MIQEMVDNMEINIKLEVQATKDALKSEIQDANNIVSTMLTQMKSSLQLASRKLDVLDNLTEKVSDVKEENYVASSLREILKCKVCTQVPFNTVIIGSCCGQILGCGNCIQKCASENSECILCKAKDFIQHIIELKGFQPILDKFQD